MDRLQVLQTSILSLGGVRGTKERHASELALMAMAETRTDLHVRKLARPEFSSTVLRPIVWKTLGGAGFGTCAISCFLTTQSYCIVWFLQLARPCNSRQPFSALEPLLPSNSLLEDRTGANDTFLRKENGTPTSSFSCHRAGIACCNEMSLSGTNHLPAS